MGVEGLIRFLGVRRRGGDGHFGPEAAAIDHAGALYRLKITRQGKLILNK